MSARYPSSGWTHGATVRPPASFVAASADPKAIFWLDGGSRDLVRKFRILGPGPGQNDTLEQGVLVENNAGPGKKPAEVTDNVIKDMRDSQANANFEGIGVRVGRNFAGTAGRANVVRNDIESYQRGGVVVDGPGSFAKVGGNTIKGLGHVTVGACGENPPPAQQGVQVGRRAGADVYGNTISDNQYSGNPCDATDTTTSYGILLFDTNQANDPQAPSVKSRLKTNRVFNNDVGIALTTGFTVGLAGVNNWLVETNRVFNNGDTSTAALDAGILVEEGTLGAGGGNRFNLNDARGNDGNDCQDTTAGSGTAGTGNVWTHNRGVTAIPAAICTP